MPESSGQAEVIEFLSSPDTFGQPVERLDTHSAAVFLVGNRALKLKRDVCYSYLDFSTLERRRRACHAPAWRSPDSCRRRACHAEVTINRRTAPGLYRGVVAVTRAPSGLLALEGSGNAVDFLVDMVRFDQDLLLDRMAATGRLDPALMPGLGDAVARFHLDAERHQDHGGYPGIEAVIRGNLSGFSVQGRGILDPAACLRLTGTALAAAERQRDHLEHRRQGGFVRRCHGDLHLRNLVLLDGCATLFDAIEFNDDLACIDVWYDLAFLLMDLTKRGLQAHAAAVLNGYLVRTADYEGLALLPLFLSCRAGVRAMTSATAARFQADRQKAADLEALAREYLQLAEVLLAPPPPVLVAVGGLSGSGKSTLARELAPSLGPVPGAVVLRSDEIRKALFGVDRLTHLGPEGYEATATARVYDTLTARAAQVLHAGHAVVVDAVFVRPEDRAAIEAVARTAASPFVGLWLDVAAETLKRRVRERGPDASDATEQVVQRQVEELSGPIAWHRLDANGTAADVLQLAHPLLQRRA
jgi:aminoglycoside phosphotransferase family enzyme/predicted kinase